MSEHPKSFGLSKESVTLSSFYVTYGMGTNLKGCYSIVHAVDYTQARRIAHQSTNGGKFAFMYSEKEWHDSEGESQAVRYRLEEVPLQEMFHD